MIKANVSFWISKASSLSHDTLSTNHQDHSTTARSPMSWPRWWRDPPWPPSSTRYHTRCAPPVCTPGWCPGCPRPSHLKVNWQYNSIKCQKVFTKNENPIVEGCSPQILQRLWQPCPGSDPAAPDTRVIQLCGPESILVHLHLPAPGHQVHLMIRNIYVCHQSRL